MIWKMQFLATKWIYTVLIFTRNIQIDISEQIVQAQNRL